MEEVQSWWEVPAVAHFCYVFRSAFNLIYFEIAELESALLNMQDPEMSISCEQLLMRLLQGFENETVTAENWDESLHELFEENLDDDENPYDRSLQFHLLTSRQKMDIIYKLCEMRLDVVDAMDEIKDVKSEDMRAKCLGKDHENNLYWYFYDERLYKEVSRSSNVKKTKALKEKNIKVSTNACKKSERSMREKPVQEIPSIDSPWSIACFTLSDWESLISKNSKSKSSLDKDLANNLKAHLPLVEASISEKDRLLRKRFAEFAPKRQSSRLLREQEKKKQLELKAQQEAEKQRLEKLAKEAKAEEERKKAIASGRAVRLRLRERMKSASDSEDEASNKSRVALLKDSTTPSSKRLRLQERMKSASESEDEAPITNQSRVALLKDSDTRSSKRLKIRERRKSASESEDEAPITNQSRVAILKDSDTRSSKRLRLQERMKSTSESEDEAHITKQSRAAMLKDSDTRSSKRLRLQERMKSTSESEDEAHITKQSRVAMLKDSDTRSSKRLQLRERMKSASETEDEAPITNISRAALLKDSGTRSSKRLRLQKAIKSAGKFESKVSIISKSNEMLHENPNPQCSNKLRLQEKLKSVNKVADEVPLTNQSRETVHEDSVSQYSNRLRHQEMMQLAPQIEDEPLKFKQARVALSKISTTGCSVTLGLQKKMKSADESDDEGPKSKQSKEALLGVSAARQALRFSSREKQNSACETKDEAPRSKQSKDTQNSNLTHQANESETSEIAVSESVTRTSHRIRAKMELACTKSKNNCECDKGFVKTKPSVGFNDANHLYEAKPKCCCHCKNEEYSSNTSEIDYISEDLRLIQSNFQMCDSKDGKSEINQTDLSNIDKSKRFGSKMQSNDFTEKLFSTSLSDIEGESSDDCLEFQDSTHKGTESRHFEQTESTSKTLHGDDSDRLAPESHVLNACAGDTSNSSKHSNQKLTSPKQYGRAIKALGCSSTELPPEELKSSITNVKYTSTNQMKHFSDTGGKEVRVLSVSSNSDLISKPCVIKVKPHSLPVFPNQYLNSLRSYFPTSLPKPNAGEKCPLVETKVKKFPIIIRSYKNGSPEKLKMLEL